MNEYLREDARRMLVRLDTFLRLAPQEGISVERLDFGFRDLSTLRDTFSDLIEEAEVAERSLEEASDLASELAYRESVISDLRGECVQWAKRVDEKQARIDTLDREIRIRRARRRRRRRRGMTPSARPSDRVHSRRAWIR